MQHADEPFTYKVFENCFKSRNILKYAKKKCMPVYSYVIMYDFKNSTTFVWQDKFSEKSFQASWFTNRTPPDETYRGVEIVVHSLVVVVES